MPTLARLGNAPRKLRRLLGRPGDFEDQIYHALVRPGDRLIDVGANKGDVALLLARLAGPCGQVVAFEPVWPMFTRFCAALRANGRRSAPVLPVPLGLDADAGEREIAVPDGNFGRGSLADGTCWSEAQHGAEIARHRTVVATLDGFLADRDMAPPDLVKVDVEGAEGRVLAGADALLSGAHRPLLVVEVFAPWEAAFGQRPWNVLGPLVERGYAILFACPRGLVAHAPTAAEPFPAEFEHGYNVIAHIPGRHDARVARLAPLMAATDGSRNRRVLPMTPPPVPNRAE